MVKALFPIGKTQWAKWNDAQREAFNEARAAGVPYTDAISGANQTRAPRKKNVLNIIEDVVEAVSDAVTTVAPIIAVAKAVRRPRTPSRSRNKAK